MIIRLLASGAVCLVMAGCVGAADSPADAPMAPPPAEPALMEPSPMAPPFITTFDPSVSQAAVDACQSTLDAQTDGAVQVVGTEFSEANSAVYMRVGANGAPWRCLVSNDGRGASTMFMGSEGYL